ncbi:hypothetical protein PIB30_048698 [Stylosanthes scabra]|uniref:Uncharacterized protein n=1 Tax=Stylosanthes scabra TaxID=79078 RepID=A0ABU6SHK6_9FABA|nr:hypothetical protein [Stylosanthes scabra]
MTNPVANLSLVFVAFVLYCHQVFSGELSQEKRIGTHYTEIEGSTKSGSHRNDEFQWQISNIKTVGHIIHSLSYHPKSNRPRSPPHPAPLFPASRSASRTPPPPPHSKGPRFHSRSRPRLRPRPIKEIEPSFPWVPEPKAFPPLPRIPPTH